MRKIFTSIITLVLMVAVLATGVFAWFTINTKTSADGLEGTAKAADGGFLIQVTEKGKATVAKDWATSVDLAEVLKGFIDTLEFTDVTTNKNDLTILEKLDKTTVTANKDYVEFDIHFLTGGTRNNVYLTKLDLITDLETTWVSEVSTEYDGVDVGKGDILSAKLSDAMRVSFTDGITTNIFEKDGEDKDVHATKSGDTITFENTTGFGGFALAYYNLMNGTELTVPTDFSGRDDKVLDNDNGYLLTTDNTETPEHDFDVSYTHYSVVTVRIWLEGWDGEAFNAVAGGTVVVNFDFEVKES